MKDEDIIIMGTHMNVSESLKGIAIEKVGRLFRHEEKIIRIQLELCREVHRSHDEEYLAKGHIEIDGAPMIVSVATANIVTSIDKVVDKLDRMLRRRSNINKAKRKDIHKIDIPAYLPKVV